MEATTPIYEDEFDAFNASMGGFDMTAPRYEAPADDLSLSDLDEWMEWEEAGEMDNFPLLPC